ncbi:MFS transporter [Pleomorphomonas sp. JP5]|uniref:MFS transporter n=1 Tax=Pleomorphomonas sp. JP5 TaxID=2942998 RepID=UPI0020436554|nr:MFS transporter [Pleomorphomonas sp. JP5]MCM5557019.1 MFS transporter [Pleomorphomonas sp. JP5]
MPDRPAPEQTAPSTGLPHRAALALLLLASTLAVMAGSAITPVMDVMRGDLGVDGTAAGLILTAHGLVIALVSPLAGWMIDRWGIRLPLAGGLLLYGIAGSAGIITDSYAPLIASRLAFGVGAAFVFTGTTVALLSLYRGAIRDRVLGWRTTATSFGGVLFPVVGGALATAFSWHATFGLYVVGLPLGLAALVAIPDAVDEARGRQADDGLASLLRPALVGVYLLVLIQAIMLYALAVFLPLRLGQLNLTTPVLVSVYMALMAATSSIVGGGFGWLGRRFSYLALLRLSAVAWGLSFLILGLSESLPVLAAGCAMLGIGNALAFSTTSVLIDEHVKGPLLGRAMAVFSTCMFSGQFVSPLLLGPLMEATSIATGYLVLSAVAAAILAVLFIPRHHR